MNRVLRRSVEYAFAHRADSLPFVREHAQEMSEDVMYQHIDLYVNDFSIDLGAEGRRAVSCCSSARATPASFRDATSRSSCKSHDTSSTTSDRVLRRLEHAAER